MDRRWQPWTLEDDGCLRSLLAIGMPNDEIATSIGRNEEEVRRRMRMLGLGVRSQPARRDQTPVRHTLTLRRAVDA